MRTRPRTNQNLLANHHPFNRRAPLRAGLLLLACICGAIYLQAQQAPAQEHVDSLWVSTAKNFLSRFRTPAVSSLTGQLPQQKIDSGLLKLPAVGNPVKKTDTKRSPLRFVDGFVQYTLNYRAAIDTPYAEQHISQHYVYTQANLVIADRLPIAVSYTGRQSNSSFFRDFHDVRVDFNTAAFQQMQYARLAAQLRNKLSSATGYWDALALKQLEFGKWQQLLNQQELVNMVLESRRQRQLTNHPDYRSGWKDSLQLYSNKILGLYDSIQQHLAQQKITTDTLTQQALDYSKKIKQITEWLKHPALPKSEWNKMAKLLREAGMVDDRTAKLARSLYAIRALSIGRTLPDYSSLTLQNVNVKGINAEYNNDWLYLAFAAGVIDFRTRDFLFPNAQRGPVQTVVTTRVGLGQRDGTHFIVTGFKGKKQLYYSGNGKASDLYGVSAAMQYRVSNHRVAAEIAQSSALSSDMPDPKTSFHIKDKSSRAWNVEWSSQFPRLQARVEANYRHTGLNFQCFNTYRVNANNNSWAVQWEQYLWKRQLRLSTAMRTNDFSNPLIVQNYNTNTVFKSAQLSFRRAHWPSLSIGYMPSSQYAKVGQQVYESRYQTFTVNAAHFYKMGTAKGSTVVTASRFYNDQLDTAFLYYNAKHVSVYQQFVFRKMTLTAGMNMTHNPGYEFIVSQVGGLFTIGEWLTIDGGVKIYHLNKMTVQTGLYGNTSMSLKHIGHISIWYDNAYLPGLGRSLTRNEQLNIGFTRYIK